MVFDSKRLCSPTKPSFCTRCGVQQVLASCSPSRCSFWIGITETKGTSISSFLCLNRNRTLKRQKKNSLKEYVFVKSALKLQCHIVQNTLLQTAFSAILSTELVRFCYVTFTGWGVTLIFIMSLCSLLLPHLCSLS